MENYTAIKINELDKCYQHGKKNSNQNAEFKKQVEYYIEVEGI